MLNSNFENEPTLISEIKYFEANDGELFQIEQYDFDGELDSVILFSREIALKLAYIIIETLEIEE